MHAQRTRPGHKGREEAPEKDAGWQSSNGSVTPENMLDEPGGRVLRAVRDGVHDPAKVPPRGRPDPRANTLVFLDRHRREDEVRVQPLTRTGQSPSSFASDSLKYRTAALVVPYTVRLSCLRPLAALVFGRGLGQNR